MRLFYSNNIDAAGVAFTAATYDSSFPPANIANELRGKPYRTGDTQAAENIVIDLGSAASATAVILLDHTLTNADTLIKLEANSSNSWGAPPFSQALTWASGTISQTFNSASYRYWRLSFTKAAAGVTRDIGRMFLGTYFQPDDAPESVDAPEEDLSKKKRSDGGQLYTDVVDSFRVKSFEFSGISTTQKDLFRTFHRQVKTHTSFFLQTDQGGSGEMSEILYGKLREMMHFRPDGWHSDGALSWRATLDFEESL